MRKVFFKNPTTSIFFISLNVILSTAFFIFAVINLVQQGEYEFNFMWLVWLTAAVFAILFNTHFVYVGAFSRVIITDTHLILRKITKDSIILKWHDVKNVMVAKELKQFFETKEKPIIVVEGTDSISREEVSLQIDYQKDIHDLILKQIENYKYKGIEKIEQYFND